MFFKPKQEQYDALNAKNEHLKDQIQTQKEELSGLINLKSEFIRNLNHELHTPVTGITSMAQAILANSKNMQKIEIIEEIKIIAQSSDRFNTYTDSILNLAKLSAPNFNLSITNVNLSELLLTRMESCMSMYSDGKNLEFITEIEHNVFARCDKHYMQIIFDNLIINSIQYSEKGNITIKLKRDDNKIIFSIEDEGIGIPEDDLHNIFEPFEMSSKTKTSTGGRGIGLALVKKALEAHNGSIWVASQEEQGSIFRFELEEK
jgi:signal transduction histidine kinase